MLVRFFEGAVEQLTRGLAYTNRRHEIIAQNLANLETPGYKARDLVFEDHLRPLLQASQPDLQAGPLPMDRGERRPRIVYAEDGASRPDGNDVNLDRQMSRLAQNTLAHHTLTQALVSQFNALKLAISGRV